MFFEPFAKGPSKSPDVVLLTICLDAFVPVDYPTVLNSGVFVFGGRQQVADGVASLNVDLDPKTPAGFAEFFTKTFGIGCY